MAFKMKYKNLEGVVGELRNAVKAHGKQADTIEKHIDEMKEGPMKKIDPMYNGKPGVQKEDFKQFSSPMNKNGPCWKGYEMIGMKKKGGRTVPNCVPKK